MTFVGLFHFSWHSRCLLRLVVCKNIITKPYNIKKNFRMRFGILNHSVLHVYSLLHGYYIFENFPSYMVITTYMFIPDCRVLELQRRDAIMEKITVLFQKIFLFCFLSKKQPFGRTHVKGARERWSATCAPRRRAVKLLTYHCDSKCQISFENSL